MLIPRLVCRQLGGESRQRWWLCSGTLGRVACTQGARLGGPRHGFGGSRYGQWAHRRVRTATVYGEFLNQSHGILSFWSPKHEHQWPRGSHRRWTVGDSQEKSMLFDPEAAPRRQVIGGVDSYREESVNVVCDRCSFAQTNGSLTLHTKKANDGSNYWRCTSCGFINTDLLPGNIEVRRTCCKPTCIAGPSKSLGRRNLQAGSQGHVCGT